MPRVFRHAVSAILAAAILLASPGLAAQQDQASAVQPAEYMIYQYPGVSLVVVVDAKETEFEARINGPEGALVSETAMTARRIGPVYQFVEAVDTPRQLMIQVNPSRRIERSRIGMELLQLPETDRNARALAAAYRYLGHGMKRVYDDNTTVWSERAYSLRNAARAFASLGMEEMKLWSELYATHLVLYEINDFLLAMERAQEIRVAAERARFENIVLATLMLEADALMLAAGDATGTQAFDRYEASHGAWEGVVALAGQLGYTSERGRALYQDGLAYEKQNRLDRAIERYEQALDVTASASDPDLMNEIRATAAAAYERRGSTSGAISLLDDIAGDLSGDEAQSEGLELARNLHEKGRLLNSTFRFGEAVVELDHALSLYKEHLEGGQWGSAGLELGWSHYSLGYHAAAQSVIEESLPRTPPGNRQAVYRAYGVLAVISRARGEFDRMKEWRTLQGSVLASETERAAFLFESAMDARHREGAGSAESVRLLQQSRQQALGSDLLTGRRAELHLCLAELQRRGRAACDLAAARKVQASLERSGIPGVEVDSELAWARVLQLAGQPSEARAVMERLLDRVQFYRERLPGVITAWYVGHRELLMRQYVDGVLAVAGPGGENGMPLLQALERVRKLEGASGQADSDAEGTRSLVARIQAGQPAPDDALSRQVSAELEAFRAASGWSSGAPTREVLRDALGEIGRNDAALAYYFGKEWVYAVRADRKGARQFRIGKSGGIRGQIKSIMDGLAKPDSTAPDAGLSRLGQTLLGAFSDNVGERIYLLASGPLNGFPFDALRLDGEYLAANHRLINLASLQALKELPGALDRGFGDRVFLAGNPRAGRDLFSYGVSSSEEIAAVRDQFVGGGLHIVQGVALRGDEFLDERYANAALLHMAMPGRVDLSRPERSRLLLSGERESPTAEFLSPADLRGLAVRAQLAVLSGTTFTHRDGTDFDSRLGLVHDLQDAGARQVLAALWPAGDAELARLMSGFYQRLVDERDVSEALFESRRALITSAEGANFHAWAGFQLFIR